MGGTSNPVAIAGMYARYDEFIINPAALLDVKDPTFAGINMKDRVTYHGQILYDM